METRTRPGWPAALDGALDGVVVAFAGWTVFYQFALAYQFSMLWAGLPWIVLAISCAIVGGLHASRRARSGQPNLAIASAHDADSGVRPVGTRTIAAGVVVVTVLVLGRDRWGVWPLAIVAIALLGLQLLPWTRRGRPPANVGVSGTEVTAGAHVVALIASLGFGVVGLFLLRPDADDAFYVNRATWVAQYGTAATNDTMFGPNISPPSYSGGLLTPSIEALQGVLANAVGIQAATLCYLVATPVLGTLAGWTTWRLVRAWAPRRHVWVMLGSLLFVLASGDSIVGGYSLGRIWQGKATAYAILIPLVWLLLSRAARGLRRADGIVLLAAGVSFVGLTTTSALLAPLIAGAALLAAAVLRSRPLALAALAFLAGPLVNGLAQVFGPAAIGGGGDNSTVAPAAAFDIAFGVNAVMILLGVAVVVLAPRLVPGRAGVLLGCGSLATMVALLPGVFEAVDLVTGAGAVAWRLVIAMPVWVLVGLVISAPVSARAGGASRGRVGFGATAAPVVAAALVSVVSVVFGTMLWKAPGASLTDRPTWKVNQAALSDLRAVADLDPRPGRWLMPPPQMEVLAISDVQTFAVVPRYYYLPGLQAPAQERSDRVVLFNLVSGLEAVEPREVRLALRRLDVSVACVADVAKVGKVVLRRAVPGRLEHVGNMYCHLR